MHAPGESMSQEPQHKRAFSGISITTNDLRTINRWAEKVASPDIRANGARLMAVDQIEQVMIEDVVLDNCEITVRDGEDFLVLRYEPSCVMLRCDAGNARLAPLFTSILHLLGAKPNNVSGRCSIDVSVPETWAPAATPARLRSAVEQPPSAKAPAHGFTEWFSRLPFMRKTRQKKTKDN